MANGLEHGQQPALGSSGKIPQGSSQPIFLPHHRGNPLKKGCKHASAPMFASSSQPCRGQVVSSETVTWSLPQGTEESSYVFHQSLWLFQCCEMPSCFHFCPPLDMVVLLSNRPWWNGDFLREHSHSCRHLDPPRTRFTLMKGLVVQTRRGVDGLGDPIDHDIGEQFLFGKHALQITVAIAPGAKLLNDPACQPHRRII